jgi:hypothetical protein
MKLKNCLIGSALGFVLAVSGAFTEEAGVMPKRVGRFYIAPAFAFAPGAFDKDGKYETYKGGKGFLRAFNLGFAFEYGINDWISGAVQWAPGATVWSDVDMKIMSSDTINTNGLADIFVGAKLQLAGEKAPLKTSLFRFSIAPGVKIPLPGPNYHDQYKNMARGDPVTAANQDKHVLGLGFRSYFDYLINERFTVNLYLEFLGYPVKGRMKEAGIQEYLIAAGIDSLPNNAISYGDLAYGYDLTFEIEPSYALPLSPGITLTAGLPLNYKTGPGKDYDIQFDRADTMFAAMKSFIDDNEGTTGLFSLRPQVTIFFTHFKLPTEFRLSCTAPLAGLRQRALHSVTLQTRFYFR